MRRLESSVLGGAAYLGFLVLFPGFLLYHYAISAGWIPPVLGGLFGAASLVLSIVALAYLAGQLHSRVANSPLLESLFLCYGLYLFVWTLLAGVVLANKAHIVPAVTEALATLLIWLAVFFVGVRIRVDGRLARRLLIAAGLGVIGVFLHSIVTHGSFLGPFLAFQGQDTVGVDGGVTTYQGVGRSIMVTAILLSATQSGLWKQLFVLFVSVAALVCLGSRSHLFASMLVIVILALLVGLKGKHRRSTLLMLSVFAITSYGAIDIFLESRAAEILNLGESTSWQARLGAQARALEIIEENPFLGDFGYHLRAGESAGYAHNALSAWALFGGLAFFIYLGLILYSLLISVSRLVLLKSSSPLWRAAFQVNLAALVLAVASEPILASVFPALGWGFTVNALKEEQQLRRAVGAALPHIFRDAHVLGSTGARV